MVITQSTDRAIFQSYNEVNPTCQCRNLKCKSQSQISFVIKAENRSSVEVMSYECLSPTYRHGTKHMQDASLKYTGEYRPGLNKELSC